MTTSTTLLKLLESPTFRSPKTWKSLTGLINFLIKYNKVILIFFPEYKELLSKTLLEELKGLTSKLAAEL